jgi:hypothetical protein
MSSMWNAAAEIALLNRVTALETARIADEAAITALEAAVAKLQPPAPPSLSLILNRDLSTGDLSQYTHRDWGLGGTDVGSNAGGGGLLNFHANVAGRRAAGLTVTPTANIGVSGSDGVYLWDPIQPWGTQGNEWWLRTSFLFPSPASAAPLLPGEAPFQATTGEWNWILELHTGINAPGPSPITFDVLTDYPVTALPGNNPRLRLRLATGTLSAPVFTYKEAPALIYDHWYEFLVHVKLDPVTGILEWFLDGQQMYSNLNVQTFFAGDPGVNLTVPNYRLHATWPSTFFIGPLCIAKTQADALAAF